MPAVRIRFDLRDGIPVPGACLLASLVRAARADLTIRAGEAAADARSFIEILALRGGARCELELVASGEDAPALLEAAVELFKKRFEPSPPASRPNSRRSA